MLGRWIDTGAVHASDVTVINRMDRVLPSGVVQRRDVPEGALADLVLLGVKPQQLGDVAAAHAARLRGAPLLVSILAGIGEPTLAELFDAQTIVRAMPNLPVAIGLGVVALHSTSADSVARASVSALMAPLGLVEWVEGAQFNAVTALAGSGPAFVYRLIDALAAAGVDQGVPVEQSARMALATVQGAGRLAAQADVSPSALADRVASPGGSTRKGLDVLDRDDALNRLIAATIAASTHRNEELAAGR